MRNRKLAGVALATTIAIAAVPAVGSAAQTKTTKARIDILDGSSFVANRYFKDRMRFNKDVYEVKSGTTIRFVSKTPDEPHTISIVKKSDLPKTVAAAGKCFSTGICAALAAAHGFPEGDGPPTTPVVNEGAAGYDVPGDSTVVDPGGKGNFKVTAKKGKTLYFMCIIHPQMQAQIKVK
jgi:plastocyanin